MSERSPERRFHVDTPRHSRIQQTRIYQGPQYWARRDTDRGTWHRNLGAHRLRRQPGYSAATPAVAPDRAVAYRHSVYTTAQQQVLPVAVPATAAQINPIDVAQYAPNGYTAWTIGGPLSHVLRKDLAPAYAGAPNVSRLLFYYSISDIHIADKESPAQPIYCAETAGYGSGKSSIYSPIIMSTPQVLDAAVQTINALHELLPFDFGLSLGDAANNTQYNELRWFIDTIDGNGKVITPSSGVHLGAASIDYQQPFYAAGLNPSIPWYQVIGNHDQYWMGSCVEDAKTRTAHIGGTIINMGDDPASPNAVDDTGYYMGVVNGLMPYGDIYGAGPEGNFPNPPAIAADANRHTMASDSSTTQAWMQEFFNTTSNPVGHGFTQSNLASDSACYGFVPKSDIPIKFIVLDDTVKGLDQAELCRRRSRRRSLPMAGGRTASWTGGQSADGHLRACAHQATKYADRHNADADVAGAGIHRRLRVEHAASVPQSHPVDVRTPPHKCRDPAAR